MAAKKTPLELSTEETEELERIARSQTVEHRRVVRATEDNDSPFEIRRMIWARTVGQRRRIIMKWDKRFRDKRVEGLEDARRSGRPARFSPGGCDALGEAGM